jgi:SAM-dependent methyltransferase
MPTILAPGELREDVLVNRRLLDDDTLSASSVVANCAMNRERQLAGVNSYERELGFHPLEWLQARLVAGDVAGPVAWLDLCCGTGRALIQAAEEARNSGLSDHIDLTGVDLVDAFDPTPHGRAVRLLTASVTSWSPPRRYDLITCVHGLHYVGDKLDVIARAVGSLTGNGLFVADFDAASIRMSDGRPGHRLIAAALREAGLSYDSRRRRLTAHGRRELRLPFEYLGADDRAGPNYTNQPAVHSYYQRRRPVARVSTVARL